MHDWIWHFCTLWQNKNCRSLLKKKRSPSQPKKSVGAVLVHTTTGSNVKRLWVAASVKKICLKCQNFQITISSNCSKIWGKISSKIFSQNWLLPSMTIFLTFTWNFTQLFLKIFPKYRKNFLQNRLFYKFPHGSFKFSQNFRTCVNFLRILEYIQISSKLSNPYYFSKFSVIILETFRNFFEIFQNNTRKFW